jgi:hypothetical protein
MPGPWMEGKRSVYPAPATARSGGVLETRGEGDPWQMASKTKCPSCGGDTAKLMHGVCRPCYMRDYHQKRSAAAVTECPRCGGVSANFVQGVCRACYMRDYHQRRSTPADGQNSPLTAGQGSPAAAAQGVCETPALPGDRAGPRVCVECREPGIYARSLCLSCYMRDRRRRTLGFVGDNPRICVECAGPGIYARGLCQNCYMRDRRRHRRIKLRACAVCGVSFESARRDALYCSSGCRQKAHRTGKTQAA